MLVWVINFWRSFLEILTFTQPNETKHILQCVDLDNNFNYQQHHPSTDHSLFLTRIRGHWSIITAPFLTGWSLFYLQNWLQNWQNSSFQLDHILCWTVETDECGGFQFKEIILALGHWVILLEAAFRHWLDESELTLISCGLYVDNAQLDLNITFFCHYVNHIIKMKPNNISFKMLLQCNRVQCLSILNTVLW